MKPPACLSPPRSYHHAARASVLCEATGATLTPRERESGLDYPTGAAGLRSRYSAAGLGSPAS